MYSNISENFLTMKTERNTIYRKIGNKSKKSYDLISNEYYKDVHITCRLFDRLNKMALANWEVNRFFNTEDVRIFEVGCGMSNIIGAGFFMTKNIFLSDISINMLAHSVKNIKNNTKCFISSSFEMPIKNDTFDLVFSFLSDAYNYKIFYYEAYRVLKKDGILFGTIPSLSWAQSVRVNNKEKNVAIFHTETGLEVELPSVIDDKDEFKQKLKTAGFNKIEINYLFIPKHLRNNEIPMKIKEASLKNNLSTHELPILCSYSAQK